eukprot:Sspe_Gene.57571::Locus_31584_Transcript_1_1_Confidence_1.000_Length_4688::g.57571::m.57571
MPSGDAISSLQAQLADCILEARRQQELSEHLQSRLLKVVKRREVLCSVSRFDSLRTDADADECSVLSDEAEPLLPHRNDRSDSVLSHIFEYDDYHEDERLHPHKSATRAAQYGHATLFCEQEVERLQQAIDEEERLLVEAREQRAREEEELEKQIADLRGQLRTPNLVSQLPARRLVLKKRYALLKSHYFPRARRAAAIERQLMEANEESKRCDVLAAPLASGCTSFAAAVVDTEVAEEAFKVMEEVSRLVGGRRVLSTNTPPPKEGGRRSSLFVMAFDNMALAVGWSILAQKAIAQHGWGAPFLSGKPLPLPRIGIDVSIDSRVDHLELAAGHVYRGRPVARAIKLACLGARKGQIALTKSAVDIVRCFDETAGGWLLQGVSVATERMRVVPRCRTKPRLRYSFRFSEVSFTKCNMTTSPSRTSPASRGLLVPEPPKMRRPTCDMNDINFTPLARSSVSARRETVSSSSGGGKKRRVASIEVNDMASDISSARCSYDLIQGLDVVQMKFSPTAKRERLVTVMTPVGITPLDEGVVDLGGATVDPTKDLVVHPEWAQRRAASMEEVCMSLQDAHTRIIPPVGTVTIVFTDIQNMGKLWSSCPSAVLTEALETHHRIVRLLIAENGGYEVRNEGDAFMIAFSSPPHALAFSMALQRELMLTPWPARLISCPEAGDVIKGGTPVFHGFRVRIGMNTIDPECQPDSATGRMDYHGTAVLITARIAGQGQGGETVAGAAALKALRAEGKIPHPSIALFSRGSRMLKGMTRAEPLFTLIPIELGKRREVWEKERRGEKRDYWAKALMQSNKEGFVNEGESARQLTQDHKKRLQKLEKNTPEIAGRLRLLMRTVEAKERDCMAVVDDANVEVPPVGHVSIVFTDIQNSTRLWEQGQDIMKVTLERHNRLLRGLIKDCKGYEVRTEGDAFMIAFSEAADALNWCVESQLKLLHADWPAPFLTLNDAREVKGKDGKLIFRGPRVRMGFDSGEPDCQRDPITGRMGYSGPMVNRCERVSSIGMGGEIVVGFSAFSDLFRAEEAHGDVLSGVELWSKGEVQLKGISKPESLHMILPKAVAGRREFWKEAEERERANKNKQIVASATFHLFASAASNGEGMDFEIVKQQVISRIRAIDQTLSEGSKTGIKARALRQLHVDLSNLHRFVHMITDALLGDPVPSAFPPGCAPVMAPQHIQHAFKELVEDENFSFSNYLTPPEVNKSPSPPQFLPSSKRRTIGFSDDKVPIGCPYEEALAKRLWKDFTALDTSGIGCLGYQDLVGQLGGIGGQTFDEVLFRKADRDRKGSVTFFDVLRIFFPFAKSQQLREAVMRFQTSSAISRGRRGSFRHLSPTDKKSEEEASDRSAGSPVFSRGRRRSIGSAHRSPFT